MCNVELWEEAFDCCVGRWFSFLSVCLQFSLLRFISHLCTNEHNSVTLKADNLTAFQSTAS